MKCHYEVLGIDLNADDEDIKKAYRKRALKWHPDKNRDNSEQATEQFRLIQAAYDVLSDPQEKAWYDRHRSEILHKKQFAAFKDETLDLLEFFTPSAYRGFGDDEKGFYSVYRDIFKKIVVEDMKFCTEDSENEEIMPDFGDSESDYDEVVYRFYAAWQSYFTKLSYVWIEKYDVREAPERRIARLIEKENKTEREKEKKKRNEIVRDLVRFVRKRDPRVRAHRAVLEQQAAKQAEKAAQKRAEMLKARVEEAVLYEKRNEEQSQEHAARVSQLEDMLKDEFGFSSDEDNIEEKDTDDDAQDEDDDFENQLFCVACNKQFKTDKAYKNHEKSKKHKEKMLLLQAEMKSEVEKESHPDEDEGLSNEEEYVEKKTKLSKKQRRKLKQRAKIFEAMTSSDEDSRDVTNETLPGSSNFSDEQNQSTVGQESDDDSGHAERFEGKADKPDLAATSAAAASPQPDQRNSDETKANKRQKHKTKSKEKPIKNFKSKSVPASIDTTLLPPNFCGTCQREYSSRNKLFQHLKSSGHSMPLQQPGGKAKKTKRK